MLCNENNLFHCQGIFWRHFSYGNFSLDFNAPSECVKQTLFCFFFLFCCRMVRGGLTSCNFCITAFQANRFLFPIFPINIHNVIGSKYFHTAEARLNMCKYFLYLALLLLEFTPFAAFFINGLVFYIQFTAIILDKNECHSILIK